MVENLELCKDEVVVIAELIDGLFNQLLHCWGTSYGSLAGAKRLIGRSSVLGKELSQRGTSSALTGTKSKNVTTESIKASSQYMDASALDITQKRDLLLADGAKRSMEQSLMSESVKNSETSFAGSCTGTWTTASSEMNLSLSSLSL